MKKVIFLFMALTLSMLSFGSAYQANITVIDEIGTFSGAYIKIKSAFVDGYGENKIYSSESITSVGIMVFNVQTSLPDIDVKLRVIKDGQVIGDFEYGPFSINGSDIVIDRRDIVEFVELIVEEEVVENESEVVENASEEVTENESEVVVIEGDEVLEDKGSFGFLTGLAMFYNEDNSVNLKYSFGGGFVFLLLIFFVVAMVFRHKKDTEVILDDDEKELKYMEKKVKETEDKIAKFKDSKAKRDKIEKAKAKLAEEEAELKDLEGEGNEKKIERQEKVVDKAEERVEEIKDEN